MSKSYNLHYLFDKKSMYRIHVQDKERKPKSNRYSTGNGNGNGRLCGRLSESERLHAFLKIYVCWLPQRVLRGTTSTLVVPVII